MRIQFTDNGITVHAVAGNHVVLLGFSIAEAGRAGLRGFGIRRTDPVENEAYWMKASKTFESVEPHPAPGEQFSTLYHPIQSFQWADYSANPGRPYTYEIVPMYGKPGTLNPGPSVSVSVATEPITGMDHTVLFNRGSVATQEYARRFQNKWPSAAGPGAYDWLSRGLLEGVIAFIGRAKGAAWTLQGALYECQWPAVLEAIAAARDGKAKVEIVFDDIASKTGPWKKNEDAIAAAGISDVSIPRRNGSLMHNKFLVLSRNGKPAALLFGSTNMTENGIFGHANCFHIVEDGDVAKTYLDYFEQLKADPETSPKLSGYKVWNETHSPAPAALTPALMSAVFSPRRTEAALQWYGTLAAGAAKGLFMTCAFGMSPAFKSVFGQNDDILRMALMEKEWTGQNRETQIAAIRALQARPNVVIAVGNRIPLSGFDQWLGEMDRLKKEVNVRWVHTKFMLIDPLSDDPIVVTGSANFSGTSTTRNDENMLVIRGSTRVADSYLGEFFRLHSHYAFRQALAIFLEKNPGKTPDDFNGSFLAEKGDWTRDYYTPGDHAARTARREYFAGL